MNIFDKYVEQDSELLTRPLPARHKTRWYKNEDEHLKNELKSKFSIEQIMLAHERSRSGILCQIEKNKWHSLARHIPEFGENMIDKRILADAFEAGKWLGPVERENNWRHDETVNCLTEMYGPNWSIMRHKPNSPNGLATFHGTPWHPAKPQGRATTLLLLT